MNRALSWDSVFTLKLTKNIVRKIFPFLHPSSFHVPLVLFFPFLPLNSFLSLPPSFYPSFNSLWPPSLPCLTFATTFLSCFIYSSPIHAALLQACAFNLCTHPCFSVLAELSGSEHTIIATQDEFVARRKHCALVTQEKECLRKLEVVCMSLYKLYLFYVVVI